MEMTRYSWTVASQKILIEAFPNNNIIKSQRNEIRSPSLRLRAICAINVTPSTTTKYSAEAEKPAFFARASSSGRFQNRKTLTAGLVCGRYSVNR